MQSVEKEKEKLERGNEQDYSLFAKVYKSKNFGMAERIPMVTESKNIRQKKKKKERKESKEQ